MKNMRHESLPSRSPQLGHGQKGIHRRRGHACHVPPSADGEAADLVQGRVRRDSSHTTLALADSRVGIVAAEPGRKRSPPVTFAAPGQRPIIQA
jgi:hypothetical protein